MTVPKRFDVLRFFSALLKVFAWIALVLAVLSAIGIAIFGGQMTLSLGNQLGPYGGLISGGGAIVAAIMAVIGGLLYFVMLFAFGEFLSMLLATEENTRLSAALLLKMHQDSLIETRSGAYPGGFTSEPEPYK